MTFFAVNGNNDIVEGYCEKTDLKPWNCILWTEPNGKGNTLVYLASQDFLFRTANEARAERNRSIEVSIKGWEQRLKSFPQEIYSQYIRRIKKEAEDTIAKLKEKMQS